MSDAIESALRLFLVYVACPALDPVDFKPQQAARRRLPKRRRRHSSTSSSGECSSSSNSSDGDDDDGADDPPPHPRVMQWSDAQIASMRRAAMARATQLASGCLGATASSASGGLSSKSPSSVRDIIDNMSLADCARLTREVCSCTSAGNDGADDAGAVRSDLWSWDLGGAKVTSTRSQPSKHRRNAKAVVVVVDVDDSDTHNEEDGDEVESVAVHSCDAARGAAASLSLTAARARPAADGHAGSALEVQCWIDAFCDWLTHGEGADGTAVGNAHGLQSRAALILFFLGVSVDAIARATRQQCVDAVVGSVFCVVAPTTSKTTAVDPVFAVRLADAISVDDDDEVDDDA